MAESNKLEVVLSILDKATAPLQAFNKRIEHLQEPLRTVSNRLSLFGKAAGLGELREGFGRVGESIRGVGENLRELAEKNLIVGAIAGGVLFELIHSTAEYGDSMLKASQKAGVGIESFEKLAYAGKLADVSQEDLSVSLGKLNKNIVGAATGSKEMQVWFQRAHISMKQLRTENAAQIFARISDAIEKLPVDSPRRAALAMALLGKSGANLIPMLKDGSAGLKEAGDEAERFGLIMDKEAAENAEKFNDDLTRLGSVLIGVRNTIGVALMPTINALVNTFRDWIIANRELIAQRVEQFATKLAAALPDIIDGAKKFFSELKDGFDVIAKAVDMVGGLGNALLIIGAIQLAPLIGSLIAVGQAIFSLGMILLTTPVGWFLLAIAAIAGAVYLIYKNWDGITAWFCDLWKGIKETVSDAFAWFLENMSWHPLALIVNNWEPIKTFFADLWSGITAGFDAAVKYITDKIAAVKGVFSSIGNFGSSLFGGGSPQFAAGVQQAQAAPFSMGPAFGFAPMAAASGGQAQATQTVTQNASVSVDFKNVPRGTEVTPGSNNRAPLDLTMGYSMVTP